MSVPNRAQNLCKADRSNLWKANARAAAKNTGDVQLDYTTTVLCYGILKVVSFCTRQIRQPCGGRTFDAW